MENGVFKATAGGAGEGGSRLVKILLLRKGSQCLTSVVIYKME